MESFLSPLPGPKMKVQTGPVVLVYQNNISSNKSFGPGVVLSTLHILAHLILRTTLGSRSIIIPSLQTRELRLTGS